MNWLSSIDPSGQIILILISVALGAFVGLRREIEMQRQGVPGFVGFRTMPLITLLGTISTFFVLFPFMPILCFLGILGFLGIAYYNGVFQLQYLGLTSELSTLIMFMVGVLVGYNFIPQAIVITVFVAIFSAFKVELHFFAKTISPSEWSGALQLLVISAIVLPVLPRTAIDPWDTIIPYDIWLLVIFISAIGFVGYFFNKYLGKKQGILLTSVLGSLISSTVVTTHLAIEARKDHTHKNHDLFILGIIIAIATMLLRVAFVIVVLTPAQYVISLAMIPLSMFGATVAIGLYWYGKSQDELLTKKQLHINDDLHIKSSFDIVSALQFAALFIVVMLWISLGKIYFGDYGVIATTFLSAFADVDAAVVSVLQALRMDGLGVDLITLVITIALVVNTMVKALYVWVLSRDHTLGRQTLLVTSIASLTGIIGYLIL